MAAAAGEAEPEPAVEKAEGEPAAETVPAAEGAKAEAGAGEVREETPRRGSKAQKRPRRKLKKV